MSSDTERSAITEKRTPWIPVWRKCRMIPGHWKFWKEKCLEYSRYMAYNMPDRDEAITYFDYLSQLEHYLNTHPEIQQQLPDCLKNKPKYGAQELSMRPAQLKQKPKKK